MIPISKTLLDNSIIKDVSKVLKSGWLVQGKKVSEFESAWSKYSGSKYSCATTSCTSGLIIALKALNVKIGDEVIVPSFTWVSTANVVELVGAKPVFIDISLDDFNLDVDHLIKLINKKTKAIIAVHLFGMPAYMNKINYLAKKYKLFVIEDAACGFGSYIKNKHVGNFGDIAVFSFHPRKAITTGEGGMITCKNKNIYKKLKILRDHGAYISDFQRHFSKEPYFLADHVLPGYNQRMTDIQAAVGLGQIKFAKLIENQRKHFAKVYNMYLKDIDELVLPKINIENKLFNGFQSYPCLIKIKNKNLSSIKKGNYTRNKLMKYLFDRGVSTRPSTHAIHLLSFYKRKYKIHKLKYINSFIANECSISLPLYYGITNREIKKVCNDIKKFFKN